MMVEYFITGGLGQLGYFVLDYLKKYSKNSDLIVIDDFSNSKYNIEDDEIIFFNNSILDDQLYLQLSNYVTDESVVIHLAAQISVPLSIKDPIFDNRINSEGTLKLLQWAFENNINNFVTIGSAAALGEPEEIPIPPNHPQRAISPYGISKMSSERYTLFYRKIYDLNYKVVRPFNMYSNLILPGDPYSGVITKFVEFSKNNEPFIIEGDGSQQRDFIHAKDVAKIVVKSIDDKDNPIINAATGIGTSVLELAKLISEIMNIELKLTHTDPRAGDIHTSIGKRSVLLDDDFIPIHEGIKDVL